MFFGISGSKLKKMKLVYKVFIAILLFLSLLIISNCKFVSYITKQGAGQLRILRNARSISEMMEDSAVSDSLKQKLRLVEEIKRFAFDSLGLEPSKNYNTFYDQGGKPILWVATGCYPYKMQSYMWKFPIVGKVPYKGYFKEKEAVEEVDKLVKKGFDARVSAVSAWSTLGYFKDPILSEMLDQSEGQIARLIIHELTHSTLFVKGESQFNENLATFVGNEGAKQYLINKFGTGSLEILQYEGEIRDVEIFSEHILRGAKMLDSLFLSFDSLFTESQKKARKYTLIEQIVNDLDTLTFFEPRNFSRLKKELPNNAFFVGYITYHKDQGEIFDEFRNNFQGDFKKYLSYLQTRYKSN